MTRYDPMTDHPAYQQAPSSRDPWGPARSPVHDSYASGRRLRLIVSVIGIAGFLLLLLGAHLAGGMQKPVQAVALIWFLVFGIARFGLDLTRL